MNFDKSGEKVVRTDRKLKKWSKVIRRRGGCTTCVLRAARPFGVGDRVEGKPGPFGMMMGLTLGLGVCLGGLGAEEAEGQGGAGVDGLAGVAFQGGRERAGVDDGVAPFVEGDHLRQELGAGTVGLAVDGVDEESLAGGAAGALFSHGNRSSAVRVGRGRPGWAGTGGVWGPGRRRGRAGRPRPRT